MDESSINTAERRTPRQLAEWVRAIRFVTAKAEVTEENDGDFRVDTRDSFSPFTRRGRRKESQERGQNDKASPFLNTESEGFEVFPWTLSVEELG